MARHLTVTVQCHSGYRGEESPRCFYLGDRAVGVEEVIDRWLAPEHRYFKLRGDDGGIYILRHDTERDLWELTLYDNGAPDRDRLSST